MLDPGFSPKGWQVIPPKQKAEHGGKESVLYQVDTIQHLGARRAAEGLRDTEELLEDLLIDPFCLLHEFVVELFFSFSSSDHYSLDIGQVQGIQATEYSLS